MGERESSGAVERERVGGGEVGTMLMETNLGTRICLTAPTDITVGELKKYFEKVHFSCLPDIGEIKVTSILVEEKPYFYHLPNSVDMNTVFPGMMGKPWFLRVKATIHDDHQNKTSSTTEENTSEHQSQKHDETTIDDDDDAVKEQGNSHQTSTPSQQQLELHEQDTIDDALKEKGNSHQLEQHEDTTTDDAVKQKGNSHQTSTQNAVSGTPESQSKMSSTQVISVTGLINKYFSGFTCSSDSDVTSRVVSTSEIEVQSTNRALSCCSKRKINAMPHSTPKPSKTRMKALPQQLTPKTPLDMVSKTSGSKNTKFIVGERLLSASKSFRGCMTERSPSLSVCKFNNDRDKSHVNGSVFSISDSDH